MSTTLIEARTALHKLSLQFPAPSSYADHLSILSDYFDNQVPLSIENKSLLQRVAVLEAMISHVRNVIPMETVKTGARKGVECTAWMGCGKCECPACRVSEHA